MISKCLQIFGLQPRISKGFLDHLNSFFSQKFWKRNTILRTTIRESFKNSTNTAIFFLVEDWIIFLILVFQKATMIWQNLPLDFTFRYKHQVEDFTKRFVAFSESLNFTKFTELPNLIGFRKFSTFSWLNALMFQIDVNLVPEVKIELHSFLLIFYLHFI